MMPETAALSAELGDGFGLLNPAWAAIIVALLLGVAGIFQDSLRALVFRPRIGLSIKVEPPDCHKTSATHPENGSWLYDLYQLRFSVANSGNRPLRGVEAMLLDLERRDDEGGYTKEQDFVPMNLRWSYYRNVVMDSILPGFTKHLDFGHVTKLDDEMSRFEVEFTLDTAARPNTGSTILVPGEYRVTLKVGGTSVQPSSKRYYFKIGNKWTDSESVMFAEHIHISEV